GGGAPFFKKNILVLPACGGPAAKTTPADIKSYPGAGHSFANKLPGQPLVRIAGFGYNEAATEDAWRRVFEFFGQHLRAGSPGEP
ncbi:dienelactone hydrolase family protein, partial [Mycobacterium tuberculosis]|uniref:dienelactone hydrolase family protein n=1 Tax=Mycobacterium tuberculosis TaxID=1773 RepID=UPI001F1FCC94